MILLPQNKIFGFVNLKIALILLSAIFVFTGALLFDKDLVVGLLLLFLLSVVTFFVLRGMGVYKKHLLILFLVVFFIHLGATLFIHYAEFYPFGGGQGDQRSYNAQAVELSENFREGNFSLEYWDEILTNNDFPHYYPLLVGVLYAITIPSLLVGQLFNVWLVVLSALLAYFISLEIGISRKLSFLSGFLVGIYPSYLYFGSLLLRETFVVFFALISLLFIIKIIKRFSWKYFLIFYISTIGLVHFRFYIGFVMIATFIIIWPIVKGLYLKQKILYGILIAILLGFIPQLLGYGYYGIDAILQFLSPEKIEYMREKVYISSGSTVIVETGFGNLFTFIKNYLTSFLFVSIGPFPWHVKYIRHLFVFAEIVPWYFLIFFIAKGVIKSRSKWRIILPLLIFPLGVFMITSLFIDNFGIYMRIRIPAFIALFSIVPLYFDSPARSKILEFSKNIISNMKK